MPPQHDDDSIFIFEWTFPLTPHTHTQWGPVDELLMWIQFILLFIARHGSLGQNIYFLFYKDLMMKVGSNEGMTIVCLITGRSTRGRSSGPYSEETEQSGESDPNPTISTVIRPAMALISSMLTAYTYITGTTTTPATHSCSGLTESVTWITVSSVHQGCIYLIKNTVKTLISWKIITI